MPALSTYIVPDSVRRAIDTSYEESDLPNPVITDAIFVDPVIAEVKRLDPLAESRDGDAAIHIKNAVNLLLAATILPSAPLLEKEDFGDGGGYTRAKRNIDSEAAKLRARAVNEIDLAKGIESAALSSDTPPTFIVVQG